MGGRVGYHIDIAPETGSNLWTVVVRVALSRDEASRVFLSGDLMVFWPIEGLEQNDALPVGRKSMFLSQIAASSTGLRLTYRGEQEARRAASLIKEQLSKAGLNMTTEELAEGRSGQRDFLREALEEYMTVPGMRAAMLVSDQGLIISSVAKEGTDTFGLGALAVDAVAAVQNFGRLVQAGTLDTMRVEFEGLSIVAAPFSPDVLLILVADAGSLGALSGRLADSR